MKGPSSLTNTTNTAVVQDSAFTPQVNDVLEFAFTSMRKVANRLALSRQAMKLASRENIGLAIPSWVDPNRFPLPPRPAHHRQDHPADVTGTDRRGQEHIRR